MEPVTALRSRLLLFNSIAMPNVASVAEYDDATARRSVAYLLTPISYLLFPLFDPLQSRRCVCSAIHIVVTAEVGRFGWGDVRAEISPRISVFRR